MDSRHIPPTWPPDDMCARLLSPVFQEKVLKLQRDLEEAKAESQILSRQAGRQPSNCYEPTTVYVYACATLCWRI